jgi:hypothetical protein
LNIDGISDEQSVVLANSEIPSSRRVFALKAERVELSIIVREDVCPLFSSAAASADIPLRRRDFEFESCADMLAERSSNTIVFSGFPEKEKKEIPPRIGRASAETIMAMASILKRRIRSSLRRAIRVEDFDARKMNIIAAQSTVLYLILFMRCINGGSRQKPSSPSIKGSTKNIFANL